MVRLAGEAAHNQATWALKHQGSYDWERRLVCKTQPAESSSPLENSYLHTVYTQQALGGNC